VADHRLELVLADARASSAVARAFAGRALASDPGRRTIALPTDGSAAHVRALLDEVDPGGDAVERFALHGATLDDVFLELTQEATHG
jgi:ABC-2 type transport system ATP-binding protein